MKITKRILCIACSLCIMMSLNVTGYAMPVLPDRLNSVENAITTEIYSRIAEINMDEEISKAQAGYIGDDIDHSVLDRIDVAASDDLNVSYTVRKLGTLTEMASSLDTAAFSLEDEGNVYMVTASGEQKSTTGSNYEDYVNCVITLVWIDNTGTDNKIVKCSGSWASNGRTLSNRNVKYGVYSLGSFVSGRYESRSPSTDSFEYFPSRTLSGLTLRAESTVKSGGYPSTISCSVMPTIFD